MYKFLSQSRCYKLRPFKVVLLLITCVIAATMTQCKKDPVKGWDFYYEPPPPPEIVNINAVIKDCVPAYPVTFYPKVINELGNLTYEWDFDDGNTSTDKFPTHSFEQGDYTIILIVSNEIGADTAYLELPQLNQPSIPVVADFSYSHYNDNNFSPTKVLFENNSNGARDFYWYFGDGNEQNHDNPEHIYEGEGTYTVTLRGTCSDGTFDETTRQVFVTSPPKRVFIDSLNLMLPSGYRNNRIFIELVHNTMLAGYTLSKSTSSYPMKFRSPGDFPGGYHFNNVQFSANEIFKFVIFKEMGEDPPAFLYEIVLSPRDIQANFYPKTYFQLETVPSLDNVFIDLYLSY